MTDEEFEVEERAAIMAEHVENHLGDEWAQVAAAVDSMTPGELFSYVTVLSAESLRAHVADPRALLVLSLN